MRMRGGVAALAAASAIGLGAGLMVPPAPAQAASNSYLGGTALDPEGVLQLVLGESAGTTAYQTLQAAGLLGESNSTAVFPLSYALSLAGAGESATAFSMLGLSLATTDLALPTGVAGLPVRLAVAGLLQLVGAPQSAIDSVMDDATLQAAQVACLGGLTVAYSSTDGACVNALGVLNGDYNPNDSSISGALVNPLAILSLLTEPGDVTSKLINGLLSGDSRAIQKFLTDDFVRLGFSWGGRTGAYGLPSIVSLTSDYGLKNPITVKWLGQEVTIFPKITSSATNVATPNTPNYLGFPVVTTGTFDPSQIIPDISGLGFNNIRFPGENLVALASLIGDLIGGSNPLSGLSVGGTNTALQSASSVPTTFSALQQTVGTTGTTPSTFATRSASAGTTPQTTTGTTGVAGAVPNAVQKFQSGAKNAWQSGANAAQQTQQNWAERQQQRTEQWRSGWQQNGGTNQWSTQGGQSANQTPAAPGAGSGWRPSVPSAPSAPSFSGFGANGGNQSNQSSSSTSNN